MNVAIEVKKTPAGKILARRLDGQPLTNADRAEARAIAAFEIEAPRAWMVAEHRSPRGDLVAVEICSALLDDEIIVVLDPDRFTEPADSVTYMPAELAALRDKAPTSVIAIHQVKRIFAGAKVLQ